MRLCNLAAPKQVACGLLADFIPLEIWHRPQWAEHMKTFPNVMVSIKKGDVLSAHGDILLCPILRNYRLFTKKFRLLNTRARMVLDREGTNLRRWLEYAIQQADDSFSNEGCFFLPLRWLAFRGVIFVPMAEDSHREMVIDEHSLAAAIDLASRLGCCKLTITDLISRRFDTERRVNLDNFFHMAHTFIIHSSKPDFNIEFVFREYQDFMSPYYIEYISIAERLPYCAKLRRGFLSRSDLARLPEEYRYSWMLRREILHVFTDAHVDEIRIERMVERLARRLGEEYETGLGRGNKGYLSEIKCLSEELPWNAAKILEAANRMYNERPRKIRL